ncbi:hypothetical protein C8J56DRAFT_1170354 [Mycena floridula]|nr:hypothetical protein C8J56DRAFT_1170354 [Mycena floridula]
MSTSLTLLTNFPEEPLHQIVLSLVDDSDYEYRPYPKSLHHVSTSFEDLERLKNECIIQAAFTSFIRIFEINHDDFREYSSIDEILLRLLRRLTSLAWLELDGLEIDLVRLKTAAIHYLNESSSISQSTASLDRLLLHSVLVDDDCNELPVVQRHSMRTVHLELDIDALPVDLETIAIRSLRKVTVNNTWQTGNGNLHRFHDFLGHHPSLTKIKISLFPGLEESNISKNYTSRPF